MIFYFVNKKILIIILVIMAGIFVINLSFDSPVKDLAAFHITLADPNLYVDGVYSKEFILDEGEYFFRFVPNGSSPTDLSIKLVGDDSFNFSKDFHLVGTPHDAGSFEYFTWEYQGEKNIIIYETQKVFITINPNGDVSGSVSVDIVKN